MSAETINVAGFDGSGNNADWRLWTASVDGMGESEVRQAHSSGQLGRTGLHGVAMSELRLFDARDVTAHMLGSAGTIGVIRQEISPN